MVCVARVRQKRIERRAYPCICLVSDCRPSFRYSNSVRKIAPVGLGHKLTIVLDYVRVSLSMQKSTARPETMELSRTSQDNNSGCKVYGRHELPYSLDRIREISSLMGDDS